MADALCGAGEGTWGAQRPTVGHGTALKSLFKILLSTGCVSVQEFKGEEAMRRAQAFQAFPIYVLQRLVDVSHKKGHSAKFTLWSHWQTAPRSSCSSSHVLSPPTPIITYRRVTPCALWHQCCALPRAAGLGTVLTASSLPGHSSHLIASPPPCSGPSLEHDGFCCISALSQNKMHAAPTSTRATAPWLCATRVVLAQK